MEGYSRRGIVHLSALTLLRFLGAPSSSTAATAAGAGSSSASSSSSNSSTSTSSAPASKSLSSSSSSSSESPCSGSQSQKNQRMDAPPPSTRLFSHLLQQESEPWPLIRLVIVIAVLLVRIEVGSLYRCRFEAECGGRGRGSLGHFGGGWWHGRGGRCFDYRFHCSSLLRLVGHVEADELRSEKQRRKQRASFNGLPFDHICSPHKLQRYNSSL